MHDSIALAQFLGLMLDDDEADALLAHSPNQREHLRPALRVEIGGRLVEHDDRGPQREHRRDGEPLLLSA